MGLTDEMIKCIKDETIPRLKEEYNIKSSKEFEENNDDIDMVWLTSSARCCELSEADLNDPEIIDEIENWGDAEQIILNWVYDWLCCEEW